ncbi:hypothetical protein THAOC_11595 [Thalassiosira oceanica]|uniref:Uncharacterized protein n=1 Tax=Thalassiosira oceanica TaxID=159749 RepID=K0TA18_THAOC|nr:hypothetical protein THAOC_11595 [Thalassiosira oceanica]|eukprot:EJK67382.1 hypothetical protein THAOC_11595 [Thalassiosira oceanica]
MEQLPPRARQADTPSPSRPARRRSSLAAVTVQCAKDLSRQDRTSRDGAHPEAEGVRRPLRRRQKQRKAGQAGRIADDTPQDASTGELQSRDGGEALVAAAVGE